MQERNASNPEKIPLSRIVVVGTTGSGKTRLARLIATKSSLPLIQLDALNWGPNWTQVPVEVFHERIASELTGGSWVVDGNYTSRQNSIWPDATMLVWLDYSFPRVLWQLWWRTLSRAVKREIIWGGNRESIREQFFSRDSLLVYALKTHKRRRVNFKNLLLTPECSHLQIIHLRSPSETKNWLRQFNIGTD